MGETEIYAITNLIVDRGPQIKVKCLNDISHHSHPFSPSKRKWYDSATIFVYQSYYNIEPNMNERPFSPITNEPFKV